VKTAELNSIWSYLIIEELVRNGVTQFCISPGSRSTPLTVAVAKNKRLKPIICYDERGAAYFSVGYARATGKPAALICTSGTAVANYFPAVIEASQDRIPMIILSADRPPELRDTGANQTIDQVKIFGGYVNWHFDLPAPDENLPLQSILTTIDQAVYRSFGTSSGPVHLNCMFREPLISDKNTLPVINTPELNNWKISQKPFTTYHRGISNCSESQYELIASHINTTNNGLLIIGRLNSKVEIDAVRKFAMKLNWPVFADITSGLRFDNDIHNLINYYDLLLHSATVTKQLSPEMIIQIGDQFVSKRLLTFLNSLQPQKYFLINDSNKRYDPMHIITDRIEADIPHFCNTLSKMVKTQKMKNMLNDIVEKNNQIGHLIANSIDSGAALSEISVTRIISKLIPKNTGLFLASSMPIRDMDMYAGKNDNFISVGSNRGTSGIDGTIASAAGFAGGLQKPVTLIIGDLAFIHDLNSLALIVSTKYPVIIIVINNHGGGIFSFLPISQQIDVFEKYFGTPHSFHFEYAAKLFHLDYLNPKTVKEFKTQYQTTIHSKKSAIIEIESNREENYRLHKQFESKIRELLGS